VRNSPGTLLNGTFALELDGIGTQHEKQVVTVSAATGPTITRGQFRLNLAGNVSAVTDCIDFDASASEVEAAIEAVYPHIDVAVARSGDGTASSSYGYSWLVVFLNATSDPMDVVQMNVTDGPANGVSMCASVNPTSGSWAGGSGHTVVVTTVDEAGSDLTASSSISELEEELGLVVQAAGGRPIVGVQKTLADAEGAVTFTVSLNGVDGDASQVVCRTEQLFAASGVPTCSVQTRAAGNAIGGSFRLRFREIESTHSPSELTASLTHDVSAADIEIALESLVGIGNVTVRRTDADEIDSVGGFRWTITFLGFGTLYDPLRTEDRGDVPQLEVISALRGKGATARAVQLQRGNELGGKFRILRGSQQTAPIDFDATTDEFKTALMALGGAVEVGRASAAAPASGLIPDD